MVKRTIFPLLASLLAFIGSLDAQPFVKLGLIEQPAGQIELRLLPNGAFSGVVSSTVITVRWVTTPGVSLDGDLAAYVNPAYNSSVGGLIYIGTAENDGYSYATWATFGNAPLGVSNAWAANVEIPFFRVPIINTAATCVDFEVMDDQFQFETNAAWYISLAGADRTNGFISTKQLLKHYPNASCQDISALLTPEGTVTITAEQVNNGFLNCPSVSLSLDRTEFTCADLGINTVTLTADANGNITTCTATVTVIQEDHDGDLAPDCDDACPYDPMKSASPGACGCGIVDVDTNNNGICDPDESTPDVRLGIVEVTGGELQLRLLPFEYFEGIVSNTLITVRWITTPGVDVIGENAAYINPAYNASIGGLNFTGVTTDGIYSYATWATIGNTAIGSANAWQANTEIPFFNIPYTNTSGSCIDFMVVDDAYQTSNFIAWYISLAGEDRTDGYIPGKQIVKGYPDVTCHDLELALSGTTSTTIIPQDVNASFLNCTGMSLSLDRNTFDCNDLGNNIVILTAVANGRTTSCTSTITVISPDTDGDGTNDCNDLCPADPMKTTPGLCGCDETDIDTNNNGICDDLELPPNVKVGMIEQPAGSIEFLLLPDDHFNGIVSNVLVTVRWLTTPGVYVDGSAAAYVNPALAGPMGGLNYGGTSIDGLYSYATWATFGTSNIGNANAWTAGQEIPFFKVPIINTSGTCIEFELLYDTYQITENIGWYIALSGEDKTDGFIPGKQTLSGYPDVSCQNISVTLDVTNSASILPIDINTSFNGCPEVDLSLNVWEFDCGDVGTNEVTLTADANGRITTCNSTVTVISLDDDGDGTVNCSDACPADPLKTDPGLCGCSEVDIDTNNNGICDAQEFPPNVKLGIVEAPNAELELRLLPDDYFDGIVSNTVITVRWITTPGVTIDGNAAAYVNPAYAGSMGGLNFVGVTTNGIYSYASWATFGNSNIGAANAWTAGVEVPLFRVPYINTSGACIDFEVIDDQYQEDNILAWYISLSGQDKTDGYIAGKQVMNGLSTAGCQNITLQLDVAGNASILAEDLDPASSTWCGVVSASASQTSVDCSDVGANSVTLTLNYANGSSSCLATVTVEDLIAPVAICQNITVQLDASGNANITPAHIDNGSTDACGIAEGTLSTSSFTCANIGTNSVTLTVTDENGNTSTCTATVNVQDLVLPSITCPAAVSISTDAGLCTASGVVLGSPATSDNCEVDVVSNDAPSTFPIGTTTVTWTVTDVNGNSSTCTQIVTVTDDEYPIPDLASLPDATGECSVTLTAPTASDNCVAGSIAGTTSDPISYNAQGTYIITWSFNDGNGNVSTQAQTVVVDDVTSPVPDLASLPDAIGECSVTVSAPTATDNCSGTITGTTTDPINYNAQGTYTITWTYNDGNGNVSTQAQTVIVDDVTSPVPDLASLPDAIGECSVIVVAPTATDNCSGSITGTTSDPTSYNAQGTYTITWSFNDGNGNVSTQSQTVVVDDVTSPVPDLASLPDAIGECSVTVTAPTATDNCSGSITGTTTDPTTYNVQGTYTITWSFNDGNGNVSTQQQTVIVDDVTSPVPDLTSLPDAIGECSVAVVAPTATDNCSGSITGTTTDPISYNAQGTYTITWNFNDGNGNASTQAQTVIVDDVTSPFPDLASLPDAIGECSVTVTAPTSTDNCSGSITGTTSDPITYNAQGTYTITWSFNDGNGNVSTQQQTVIVDDVTSPVPDLTSLPDAIGECSVIVVAPTATDNCSGSITGTTTDPISYNAQGIYTITWNFNDGNGNASTQAQTVIVDDVTSPFPDLASLPNAIGDCSVTVTAPTASDNCSGSITGTTSDPISYNAQGTYTITWSFNDGNGNVSTQQQTVIVDDVTSPVPDLASLPDAIGECSVTVTAPTASDNCSGSITGTTSDPTSFNAQGTYTITWSFNDGNGNVSTQTQTVVVDDVTAPIPDLASLPDAIGECSVTVSAPTASDNCSGTITGTTSDPTSYNVQGTYTITWSFNDGNGNVSTQAQTVVVDDVTAPIFTDCPGNISVMNDPGNCNGAIVFWSDPAVADNCDQSVQVTMPMWNPGDLFPIGITNIAYFAVDDEGNAVSCNFSIEVQFLDADNDGICDELDQCAGAEPGTSCDDGDPLTLNDVITSGCVCAGEIEYVDLSLTVLLDGPYDENADLMKDDLRSAGLIPGTHPFTTAPFGHIGNEEVLPAVLSITGTDAIVDWILVELRDATDAQVIIQRRAGLLQRDGDIVDLDGASALRFNGRSADDYFVAVRHRNHLGVMTGSPVALSSSVALIDLTDPLEPNFGSDPALAENAQKLRNDRRMLWAGNVVTDGILKYAGGDNDRDPILTSIGGLIPTNTVTMVYQMEDVNLDGTVQYAGAGNDRDPILFNIGGEIPTATRQEQLP